MAIRASGWVIAQVTPSLAVAKRKRPNARENAEQYGKQDGK
jgi:hypothetical protein